MRTIIATLSFAVFCMMLTANVPQRVGITTASIDVVQTADARYRSYGSRSYSRSTRTTTRSSRSTSRKSKTRSLTSKSKANKGKSYRNRYSGKHAKPAFRKGSKYKSRSSYFNSYRTKHYSKYRKQYKRDRDGLFDDDNLVPMMLIFAGVMAVNSDAQAQAEQAGLRNVNDLNWDGKNVYISGQTDWDRDILTGFLEKNGANITDTITDNTDLVVAGSKIPSGDMILWKRFDVPVVKESTLTNSL